jgi:hypothetical protein
MAAAYTTRRAVRFWGHDGAMEWSFIMTEDALELIESPMRFDEAVFLCAFDAHRDPIQATARRVYAHGRRGSHEISSPPPSEAPVISVEPPVIHRGAHRRIRRTY